jgi:hypothetical protein
MGFEFDFPEQIYKELLNNKITRKNGFNDSREP